MHGAGIDIWTFLFDALLLLGGATLIGLVVERLGQSALLGYILAGMLLGPGALHLVESEESVAALAELGVALLLFTIGLEFSLGRLRSLGPVVLWAGVLQIGVTIGVVTAGAGLAGLSMPAAVALGAIVAPSSTACVLRLLRERGTLDSAYGRPTLGILLLQDAALVPLVLLVTTLGRPASALEIFKGLAASLGLGLLLILVFFALGRLALPGLLSGTARVKSRELFVLLAVTTFLGAAWAAHHFGLSPALGAFVAGMLLAESPFAAQLRADIGSLRILFVTLFFTSVGMLADVGWVASHFPEVVAATAGVIALKGAIIWGLMAALGVQNRYALATGLGLSQVGEFSFVLGGIAFESELISDHLFHLLVAATVGSLLLTPALLGLAADPWRWARRFGGGARRGVPPPPEPDAPEPAASAPHGLGKVIVVGFGPAGRRVVELLREEGFTAYVVDLNPDSIEEARRQGLHAEVGDATQTEILEHLDLATCRAMAVTLPDHRAAQTIIAQARAAAPDLRVFARARLGRYARDLAEAGAELTVNEEEQIGEKLGREITGRLL